MKHLFTLLFLLSTLLMQAQCPTCVPDETCISTDGLPTVCPALLPEATSNVYYEQYLTFYLPAQVNDPNSGIDATLLEVTITSVTGLPFGMGYSVNSPNATYYPSQGDNFGCATICGTPLLPGSYEMLISVSVLANAFGFEVTQNQSFTYTLIVNPGEGGVGSFSYSNSAGCGFLEVDFNAQIAGVDPQVTNYTWDFGNGDGSTDAHPSTVLYDSSGDYTVVLNTTISDNVLTNVHLDNVSGNWNGDIDDLLSNADPYFKLTDGNGNIVYTSSVVDNVTSTDWNGLSLVLSSPPYSLVFWDDDLITQDDALGTAPIAVQAGVTAYSSENGTVGNVTIELNIVNDITDSTLITVFPIPDSTFSVNGNTIVSTDQSLVSYTWTLNDIILAGVDGPSFTMVEGGVYSVELTNQYGCSSTSEPYLFCPEIVPLYDALSDELSVSDSYLTYQWYYNGLEINGATTFYLIHPENGNYAVEVTTNYGCTITSEVIVVAVGVNEKTVSNFSLYPNPADNALHFSNYQNFNSADWTIFDMSGKQILSGQTSTNSGEIDIRSLVGGMYQLTIVEKNGRMYRSRFVKN